MAKIKERTTVMLEKISMLKDRISAADELSSALEKDKGKLPASVKSALTAYGKKK